MGAAIETDICVIGAGSGGLSVAAGAAQMGARTVLIERGKMGGDCLNYGCVPSKAMLAAAHAAEAVRGAGVFGVNVGGPEVDGGRVREHVRGVIAAIAPNDSVERFEGLGVRVLRAHARFVSPSEIDAEGQRVRARRFVVATGSSPATPPIDGLSDVPYLTNETIFDLAAVPEHLVIVGGGPIGVELAQAHRQLGARVTVLEASQILPKDDPELVDVVRRRLSRDGVEIREGVKVAAVGTGAAGVSVTVTAEGGQESRVEGSHLLVATGRRVDVDGLGLEEAGIAWSAKGIEVDARLRTANRKVYAIGDAAGGLKFTHVAGYHASIVLRNALFRLPAKADTRTVPWVTYTAPQLAQVGLTEQQARDTRGEVRVLKSFYAENDRAQAERETEGLVKVIATPGGHVLGAGIVGAAAGELIHTWVLAMSERIKVKAVAQMIAPYPTLGEINKRAAGSFYAPKLFSERTRKLVRFLAMFP
ncbi:MAG: FAD-dependent oxidoreductase [Rhodospirillales bacterium]|nr:FAD-dependent oxidoreductase [Rhodospirillales bacterium]